MKPDALKAAAEAAYYSKHNCTGSLEGEDACPVCLACRHLLAATEYIGTLQARSRRQRVAYNALQKSYLVIKGLWLERREFSKQLLAEVAHLRTLRIPDPEEKA